MKPEHRLPNAFAQPEISPRVYAQRMEALGTLAGGIAHKLNNALTSILGFTELAMDDVQKGSRLEDSLREIYAAGNRARDLVHQVLIVSRQDEEEPIPIEIPALLKGVLNMLRAILSGSIEIVPHMVRKPLLVKTDPIQLHQLLISILTTIARSIADGSGVLEVGLDAIAFDTDSPPPHPAMDPGHYVRISVCGANSNIDINAMDKAIEPHNDAALTDIGLSAVQESVIRMGGHIVAFSQPGCEIRADLYLPRIQKAGRG